MKICHRIGHRISSNWNTLAEILACDEPLSFDGVYTEVFEHYKALKGKDVTFFVSGKYGGADNSFDISSEVMGTFCTWPQIEEMATYLGAKIGWHGWAHRKCVGLTRDELFTELVPPYVIGTGTALAWPHGVFDALALDVAKTIGFSEIYCAGPHGDGSQFQRRRSYLNW